LYGDARKGRRPSFTAAASPDLAEPLCDYFAKRLSALGVRPVQTGEFGAQMDVAIQNDGPVTLWLDSAHL
jgi:D-tyrosyl-tRNA(Tyr) deacylase